MFGFRGGGLTSESSPPVLFLRFPGNCTPKGTKKRSKWFQYESNLLFEIYAFSVFFRLLQDRKMTPKGKIPISDPCTFGAKSGKTYYQRLKLNKGKSRSLKIRVHIFTNKNGYNLRTRAQN